MHGMHGSLLDSNKAEKLDFSYISQCIDLRNKKTVTLEEVNKLIYDTVTEKGVNPEAIIFSIKQASDFFTNEYKLISAIELSSEFVLTYLGIPIIYESKCENTDLCYKCGILASSVLILPGFKLMYSCESHYTEAKIIKKLEESRV